MENSQQKSNQFNSLPLIFGGASLSGEGGGYGFGKMSEDQAKAILEHAFDLGFTIFDTAPIYGFGLSEKRLGMAFKQKREQVQIISKSGVGWHDNQRVNMSNDLKQTTKMFEESLRRMDSDYIDIYMIHWPDTKVDIRYSFEYLAKQKADGKIKSLGLCNALADDFLKCQEIDQVEYLQSEFNLFNNGFGDLQDIKELGELKERSLVKTQGWGTFDKGILTGSAYKGRKYDKVDARSWAAWWKKSNLDQKFSIVEKLSELLNDLVSVLVSDRVDNQLRSMKGNDSFSLRDLALQYCLAEDFLDYSIIGCRSIEQLDTLIESLNKPMNSEILFEAKKLVERELNRE